MPVKRFFKLLILLLPTFIYTQTDTISSRYVGPGVKHISIKFPSVPWMINVLEVELTNPYITLETVKASKNSREQLYALERTSSMASRKNYSGHTVVGAINGDFYDTQSGIPVNVQVENGEILRRPIARSVFGLTTDRRPFIEIFSFSGQLIAGDSSIVINGVNESRGSDMLIFYNSYFGFSTNTNQWGTEALVNPLDQWVINDTIYCSVDTVVSWVGNMTIPLGKAILSGHGRAGEFLRNNLKPRDTVKIILQLNPNVGKVFQAIGGLPRIISGGQNVVAQTYQQEGASQSFTYSRHPRSAIGFSEDSSKIYLVTVDGRQATSVGMTLDELANFMLTLGVWEAVNLDGGGSTTMVVRGQIVNSPSDLTGERAVSNAILVISSAPYDTLSELQIQPKRLEIFMGEGFQFKVFGYDRYFNPIQIPSNQITWSCDSIIGTISLSGLFRAGKKHDSGYVYVRHVNGLKDSCFVIVHSMQSVSISPKNVVTDTSRSIQFSVSGFDTKGNFRKLSSTDVEWRVVGEIGTINMFGIFRAFSEGSCEVVALLDDLSDTARIEVIIGKGEKLIESFDEMRFFLTTEGIDTAGIFLTDVNFVSYPKSLCVEYKFIHTIGEKHWIYINSDIPVYGAPDSIYLYVYGDSGFYRLYYFVSDDNDEVFVFTGGLVSWGNEWRRVGASTKYPIQTTLGSYFSFPIKIVKIAFYLAGSYSDGVEYAGKFCVDDLSVTYPVKITAIGGEFSEADFSFKLYQNFPNPFNSKTKIKFSISKLAAQYEVNIKIYDTLGREIKKIFSGRLNPGVYEVDLDPFNLSSGVYFCLLSAGDFRDIIKMVILK